MTGNPGIEKVDFELWSLAIAAINGCGMCLDSHEKAVCKAGLTTEQAQTALRIAAVVNAAARKYKPMRLFSANLKIYKKTAAHDAAVFDFLNSA